MSVAEGYAKVQGRCPACRFSSLFLGTNGYVTCGMLTCPDPSAANALLEAELQTINRTCASRSCAYCEGGWPRLVNGCGIAYHPIPTPGRKGGPA